MVSQGFAGERGSSSVEFTGVLPAVVLVALVAAQLVVTGYSLWSASIAARAGARAAHVGTDYESAARRALPGLLRKDSRVAAEGGAVTARVKVPPLLPLLPEFQVAASSGLEPGG